MIIDLKTHVWWSTEQLGNELAERLRTRTAARGQTMDASPTGHEQAMTCVDCALVFGLRADRLGARVPNELIAEFVSRDSRRRIGIAGIDPMSADALDQLRAAHGLGLAGVTISPASQGFHPAHSAAMRVYEGCAELSMPLFVTTIEPVSARAVLEFGRSIHWDEVAQAFPSLPIVISQLGHPWVDETLVMLSKHRNMFADISGVASRPWQLYNALLSAASTGVMDKLLFGSGYPFETPAKTIESLYSVNGFSHGTQLPAVPRSLIRGIVERDSLKCLGIDGELAPRHAEVTDDEPVHDITVIANRSRSSVR